MRVLMADDHALVREAVASYLSEREGFDVLHASTLQETLDILSQDISPEVVLLDLVMPGMDGMSSIQKVLALPDETRLFMCHDYGPNGRDIQWETTVAAEKEHNIRVGKGATKEQFVKFRTERDATLAMPKLIIPSLQVNMRAGEVPTDKDGRPMLKVPLNGL